MHPALASIIALSSLAGTAIASPPPTTVYEPATECATQTTQVYFEAGSSRLSDAAERAVEGLALALEGCAIDTIETRTVYTADHAIDAPVSLASDRSTEVQAALAKRGLVPTNAMVATEVERVDASLPSSRLPLARRVDVTIVAVSPGVAS